MQISADILVLVAGLIALGVSAYVFWRSGKAFTVVGVQDIATNTLSLAAELAEVGEMAVAAVEQLKSTGKITTDTDAFNHAFDHLQRWFPGVDRQILANTVEGSYNLYKMARELTAPVNIEESLMRPEAVAKEVAVALRRAIDES